MPSRIKITIALILTLAFFGEGKAADAPTKRKTIGLALSGGGARGLAHIGVLRVLEELRIPVDRIAGTSMGSVVGALYSLGYSPNEIEALLVNERWSRLADDKIPRRDQVYRRKIDDRRYIADFEMGFRSGKFRFPSGLVSGQNLSVFLQSQFLPMYPVSDFSKLPIPFRAVATDAETGNAVVLSSGNLADAVRASAAIPGLFSPVELNGKLLIDGATANNLPVNIVRNMGADVVIAVDISTPLSKKEELQSFVDVTDQSNNILIRKFTQQELGSADVAIVPNLEEFGTMSYDEGEAIVARGEEKTRMLASALKSLSISSMNYEAYQNRRRVPPKPPPKIRSIRIEGAEKVDRRIILRRMDLHAGDPFDASLLEADLHQIYGLGDFERVDYYLEPVGDDVDLIVRTREKRWGPNYLRYAVSYDGELKGQNDINFLANFTMTRLDRFGAEWRNDVQVGTTLRYLSEFYQPIGYSGVLFVAPRLNLIRTPQDVYSGVDRVAQYNVDQFTGEMDLGVQFGTFGELRAGVLTGYTNADVGTGDPTLPSYGDQNGALVGRLTIDRLDQSTFPRRGILFSTDVYSAFHSLGSDQSYRKLSGLWSGFESWGRHTGFLAAEGGSSFGTSLPVYDEFMLGGFRSLSGFREEELRGAHFGVGRAGYLFRLNRSPNFFYDSIYLVTWGEVGNTWANASDFKDVDLHYTGSLGVGFDTKLGPAYLAYGQSGLNHFQVYLSIGRTITRPNRKFF